MSTEALAIDFNGVEPVNEFGFDPVEPGIYEARIEEAEFQIAKSGKNSPMAVLTWRIESGSAKGRKVNYNRIIFSLGTVKIVKGVLIALGMNVPTKAVSAEKLAQAFAVQAKGKLARITVAMGDPNDAGKSYPEVKAIWPIGGPQGVPTPATSASAEEDLPTL